MISDAVSNALQELSEEYATAVRAYREFLRLKKQAGIRSRDAAYFLLGKHWEELEESLEAAGSTAWPSSDRRPGRS